MEVKTGLWVAHSSQKSCIWNLTKNQVGIDKSAGLLKTLKIENQIKGDKCFHTITGN